jgi:hypothetical protein
MKAMDTRPRVRRAPFGFPAEGTLGPGKIRLPSKARHIREEGAHISEVRSVGPVLVRLENAAVGAPDRDRVLIDHNGISLAIAIHIREKCTASPLIGDPGPASSGPKRAALVDLRTITGLPAAGSSSRSQIRSRSTSSILRTEAQNAPANLRPCNPLLDAATMNGRGISSSLCGHLYK